MHHFPQTADAGFPALLSLIQQSVSGAITPESARRAAVTNGLGMGLHIGDVTALCEQLRAVAHTSANAGAADAAELVMLAVDSREDDAATQTEIDAMRHHAALTLIHVVTALLRRNPDWRRYAVARQAGERILERAARAANGSEAKRLASHAHEELAGLYLHPLLANISSTNDWQIQTRAWYARGDRTSSTHSARFPEPEEALELARTHYMLCADVATGRARGLALNGTVSADEWIARVRGVPLAEASVALMDEALTLLEPEYDASAMSYLLALRQSCGMGLNADALLRLVAVPVPTLMQTIGPEGAVNVRVNLSHLVLPIDSRLALALIENAAPAVEAARDETLLVRHSNALLSALFEHMSGNEAAPDGPILLAAREVVGKAERLQWSSDQAAGVLLKLVSRADKTNEEAEALQIFDIARTVAPHVFDAYPAAFRFLRAVLWSGAAVNAAQAKEWEKAVTGYGAALKLALPLGLKAFADLQLMNLVGASDSGGEAVLHTTLGILFEQSLALQFALGSVGVERLQSLVVQLTEQQLAGGTMNSEMLHLTWRIAKARRFGAAWRSRAAEAVMQDDFMTARRDLLAQIDTRASNVALDEQVSGPGSNISRDRRLLAFVRDTIPAVGDTPAEQLANLQHRFDGLLEQQLAVHALAHEPEYIGLSQIQARLDRRTVILELFLGERGEHRMVMALLSSADQVAVSAVPDSVGLLKRFSEGERHELAYSYEEDVFLVREMVIDPDSSAESIAPYLHAGGGAFLHGSVGQALDALHASGCDHLVIIPHGPFHFAPLQLFARGDRLLADDWIVTVLPSVELLNTTVDRDASHERREGVAAIGLDFSEQNPLKLTELHGVIDEVERIAAVFGTSPIVNDAATPSAIRDALQSRRYVHLATHGALNLDAPAFQLLVAAPDAEDDGIVHAHELLALDLSGLELVSLGACETALGRVDRADNPRGLPAALLLAGAETVVGTLWEVESDAARVFFVTMYTALDGGASRRDAFRTAQLETRRRFPDARDWGAFYFVGAWD